MRDDATARSGAPLRAAGWIGGKETSYLRAGCGAVMLLLMSEYDGPGALELIALLSTAYLVIAPRVPRDGIRGSWLADVMDGLGIASARIAAEAAYIADVRSFAEHEEGRVREVIEIAPVSRTPSAATRNDARADRDSSAHPHRCPRRAAPAEGSRTA